MLVHVVSSANRYGMAKDKTSGISFIYNYIRQREVGQEYFAGEHRKQQRVDRINSHLF